jgi:hypothetical protein
MKKNFCFFILIFILQAASAEMDWENTIIKASDTDKSKLSDLLKDELYALQYDENTTVGGFLKSDSERESEMKELINEYKILDQHYLTDGSIEYVYQLSLNSKIISLLLPVTKPVKYIVPMLCPCCGQEWPQDKPVPEGIELVPKQIESIEYTGIIIDCRGFNIVPSLFPKIYSEGLEEIYSINFADPRHVVDEGLIQYTTKDIQNSLRVGKNPLKIEAIGVIGNKPTNIKISSTDARRIHGSKKNIQLLKECRVIVIFTH